MYRIYIMMTLYALLFFSGCNFLAKSLLSMDWDQAEGWSEQKKFLQKRKLETAFLYQMTPRGYTTMKNTPMAIHDSLVPKGGTFAQFRVFNAQGSMIGRYQKLCDGPMKDALSVFPPQTYYVDTTHQLKSELAHNIPYEVSYQDSLLNGKSYDYIFVIYWADYLGVFNRRFVEQVEDYVNQHRSQYRIALVKINVGLAREESESANASDG
ncbi:MAG: hypothetical protein AAF804_06065 [Bacteroidota bacterium]